MDWKQAIKEIQKAQEKNQLVIFVGSGVSNNSGIPTWWDLIKVIADELGYDKCNSCKNRQEDCPKSKCEERYDFSQDEYLRIPEYYFQKDTSKDHRQYYELIKTTLKSDKDSNPIDDEIFKILPHHIITTNYDALLEKSKNLNSKLYTVVSQDSDLLSKSDERYIIKMHGDLETPETIVLKESDYIDYEQKHTLISTFIRSLLVNHTFLFLGYSLNDYNLNLIIGWINYFKKFYKVEDRPMNYMVSSKAPLEYEKMRLEDKNICVIALDSLPEDLIDNIAIPGSFTKTEGKKLYSFLRCITDSEIYQRYVPLANTLVERYQVLKVYRKISFEDLINIYPLGRTSFVSTELVFYDKAWYEKISSIIDSGNEQILDVFQRAMITDIALFNEKESKQIPLVSEEQDEEFDLYINNDYIDLWSKIRDSSDTAKKIYYYHFFEKDKMETKDIINVEASLIDSKDYVSIILHKMRAYLASLDFFNRQLSKRRELEQLFDTAPIRYREAIKYIKALFESPTQNMVKMNKILEEQEKRYKSNSNTLFSGHSFTKIWEMQRYIYDYYFFFKKNYLPLDYFSDPRNYLNYYVKAILCSYSPVEIEDDEGLRFKTDRRHYPLNEIDFDIIIKYINTKSLINILENYSVQFLEVTEEVNIIKKYNNLCASIAEFRHDNWIGQLYNFNVLICILESDNECKKELFNAFCSMYINVVKKYPNMAESLFEPLNHLIRNMSVEGVENIKAELLDTLLLENVYDVLKERKSRMFSNVIKLLSPNIKEETTERIIYEINHITEKSQKIEKIFILRFAFPKEQYSSYLSNNIESINLGCLFQLVIEKRVSYNDSVFQKFLGTIENEVKRRKENPGVYSYPDQLSSAIEECIILKLIDFDIDITKLRPYAEFSEPLQFMLEPKEFDYSKVNTNNYMWQNLIYSPTYKQYFLEHKKEILSDDLRRIFDLGLETRDQQKIVYGLLLEDDELRGFSS